MRKVSILQKSCLFTSCSRRLHSLTCIPGGSLPPMKFPMSPYQEGLSAFPCRSFLVSTKDYLERMGSEGAMADDGGVHIGPWKETDMLSGDQEVVHPITCMYNFLVSTKVYYIRRYGHLRHCRYQEIQTRRTVGSKTGTGCLVNALESMRAL